MEKKYTELDRVWTFSIGVLVGTGGAWVYLLGKVFTSSL